MRRAGTHALTEEVARFQVDVRRLALLIVDTVLRREVDDRGAELGRRAGRPPARSSRGKPARQPRSPAKRSSGRKAARQPRPPAKRSSKRKTTRQPKLKAERQLDLGLVAASSPAESAMAPAPPAPRQPPDPAAVSGKRRRWTRDGIIEELATWLVNGTAIDAGFVTRYGPPGLAAAARRVFGRFDAALNVASLHVAKLYPDGPPPSRAGARRPVPPPRQEPSGPA